MSRPVSRFHTEFWLAAVQHPAIKVLVRVSPKHPWLYQRKLKPLPGECQVHRCRNKITGRRLIWNKNVCARCDLRQWRVNNPLKSCYRTVKDRATRKKIAFTITFEDFLQAVQDTGYLEKRGSKPHSLQLDRKDPLLGYVPGNLRVITGAENCAKGAGYDKARHYHHRIDEAHNLPDEPNPF